jgi:predicted PurR-regulated permease PerM
VNYGSESQAEDRRPAAEPSEPVEPAAHSPGDGRNWPLALLAVFAVIAMLHWARAVCIPVMLGVLISYALSPLVTFLHQWRIPRAVGAAVLLLGILGGIGTLAFSLSDDAAALIETLPEAAQNFRRILHKEGLTSVGVIDHMQKAANQLERAANDTGVHASPAPSGVTRVQIEQPKLNVQDFLRTGTLGAVALAGQAGVVLFLAYFLLVAGDTFRRKLVKITGPALSKKKITVQVLDEITSQIQRYLLVQIATSLVVGVATWLAFLWIGLEHAAIWGIAAAVFNTIPYLGPVVVTGCTALVALLQFGTLGMAFLVGAVALLITSLEGYLLTPWLTGRASRMNAVTVFVGVLFWGWLWGVWGLLLGVPIIMVVKAVCDRVEDLKPVGQMLGD